MRSHRSLYEVLGVSTTAQADDIKTAYRRLMKQTHPDAGGTAALADAVREAYEVLGDPARRAAYDAGRPDEPTKPPAPSSSSFTPTAPTEPTPVRGSGAPSILLALVMICLVFGLILPSLQFIYAAFLFLIAAGVTTARRRPGR